MWRWRRRSRGRPSPQSCACRSSRTGGAAILWLGERADLEQLARVSDQLGGGVPEIHDGLAVLPKVAPTPPGFPRRAGVAKKRPLA